MEKKKWVKPTVSGPFLIKDNPEVEALVEAKMAQENEQMAKKVPSASENQARNARLSKIQRNGKVGLTGVAVKVI